VGLNQPFLVEFDGVNWSFYQGTEGTNYNLGGCDSNGTLWFLTSNYTDEPVFNGLVEFTNQHEWIEIPNSEISSNYQALAIDPFNNKWLGKGGRITVYNENGVVQNNDPVVPTIHGSFNLSNYPNPFNPNTIISFDLKSPAQVQLKIYNIKGQLVKSLVDEKKQANSYKIEWNGIDENNKQVASGIYFCRIQAGNKIETKKMMLIK
jgi:hypothetical protein